MVVQKQLWQDYVWKKQTVAQLAERHRRSIDWVRRRLEVAPLSHSPIMPQPLVFVADAFFHKRSFGVCVFRSPKLKKNVYWRVIATESPATYRHMRVELEQRGFSFQAIVLDGRRGVKEMFSDIPVQMCQFHQIKIVTRYITGRPKLEAGRELREIALALTQLTEAQFANLLAEWHARWTVFLKEKTYTEDTKRWHYTHRRIRAAYQTLNTNLPYLFTYQKYPELQIPNTTNSLDGKFSHVKDLLRLHRGLKRTRNPKLINEILLT